MAEATPADSTAPQDRQSLADMVERLDAVEQAFAGGQITAAEHAAAAQGLAAAIEARRATLPLYEHGGETYRAHRMSAHHRPATADYLVRRDSDARYGGYIADLSLDGGSETYGPDDLRYQAYDDRGQYIASTSSIRGALSVFAQPNRGIRWISEAVPEPEIEP